MRRPDAEQRGGLPLLLELHNEGRRRLGHGETRRQQTTGLGFTTVSCFEPPSRRAPHGEAFAQDSSRAVCLDDEARFDCISLARDTWRNRPGRKSVSSVSPTRKKRKPRSKFHRSIVPLMAPPRACSECSARRHAGEAHLSLPASAFVPRSPSPRVEGVFAVDAIALLSRCTA